MHIWVSALRTFRFGQFIAWFHLQICENIDEFKKLFQISNILAEPLCDLVQYFAVAQMLRSAFDDK